MPISVVGTASTRIPNAVTAWSADIPAGGQSGDVAIIAAYTRGDHTISSYPANSQASYKAQWDPGDPQITLWAVSFTSAPPASVSFTMGAAVLGTVNVTLLRGATTSNTIVESSEIDNSSGLFPNFPIPALTTTISNSLVMAVAVTHQADNVFTVASGWTNAIQQATASQPGAVMAVKGVQASPATQAQENFTYSGTAAFGSAMRFSIREFVSGNQPPVVSVTGSDVVDPNVVDNFSLTASASDTDGTIASIVWEDITVPASPINLGSGSSIIVPVKRSTADVLRSYRATATDNGGATAVATRQVNMLAHTRWARGTSGIIPLRRQPRPTVYLARDTFSREQTGGVGQLETGQTWSRAVKSGNPSPSYVTNGQMISQATNTNEVVEFFDLGVSDYNISVTCNAASGSQSVMFRGASGAGSYWFWINISNAIYYHNGSSNAMIVNLSGSGVAGDKLSVRVEGNVWTFFRNGVQVHSRTETSNPQNGQTRVGVRTYNVAGPYDDFEVTAL